MDTGEKLDNIMETLNGLDKKQAAEFATVHANQEALKEDIGELKVDKDVLHERVNRLAEKGATTAATLKAHVDDEKAHGASSAHLEQGKKNGIWDPKILGGIIIGGSTVIGGIFYALWKALS